MTPIFSPGRKRGLEVPPDAHRAVRVDTPRQLDPELVLFPHVAGIGVAGVVNVVAQLLLERANDGLPPSDPLGGVRLERVEVVPLRPESGRQHVIRPLRRLAPHRSQRHVQADAVVLQHLHPRRAVRVRPHRVVHAGEVHVDALAVVLEDVREQEAHLEVSEGELQRPVVLVPRLYGRGYCVRLGDEFRPAVRDSPALGRDRACQHVEEEQAARDHPPTEVTGGGVAPDMRGESRSRAGDLVGDRDDGLRWHARLLLRPLRRVLPVHLFEQLHEVTERLALRDGLDRAVRFQEIEVGPVFQEVLPVDPPPHELGVEQVVLDQVVRHGEQHGRLGAGTRREPDIGLRRRIG